MLWDLMKLVTWSVFLYHFLFTRDLLGACRHCSEPCTLEIGGKSSIWVKASQSALELTCVEVGLWFIWLWVKKKSPGDHKFWSIFPFINRVFKVPFFDPKPSSTGPPAGPSSFIARRSF